MADTPDNLESAADTLRGHDSINTTPREECPVCDYTAITDDRVGHHIFHEHYEAIEEALGGDDE